VLLQCCCSAVAVLLQCAPARAWAGGCERRLLCRLSALPRCTRSSSDPRVPSRPRFRSSKRIASASCHFSPWRDEALHSRGRANARGGGPRAGGMAAVIREGPPPPQRTAGSHRPSRRSARAPYHRFRVHGAATLDRPRCQLTGRRGESRTPEAAYTASMRRGQLLFGARYSALGRQRLCGSVSRGAQGA
jgi:hypothetical protein